LLRILLLPLPCLLLFLESTSAKVASLALGSLLGLTDYADGLLARRLRKKSFLGALLDPVADKIFITSVFLILSYLKYVSYPLVFLLIFRELIVAVMRSLFPEDLRVVGIARIKTLLQMLFAGIIISVNAFFPSFSHLSDYLLATVVFISYISAIPYFYRFSKGLSLKPVPLFAFLRSFSTLLYPVSLLILFPNTGKLFFIPIVALNLYFFRNGLAKVIPFRKKGENFLYFLAALGSIAEYLIMTELFFSLILVLVISLYKDGLKSAKIIWDILRLR
jgi:CDP-diacylglycerol--glycerol-3-phosphate 3-phosphatidyltransferase